MATKKADSIKKVTDMMRELDFCMFTTRTEEGLLHSRPMSNNGEVEFDGDVWFFSGADTRKVAEIEADSNVELSYVDTETFTFLSMSGEASIVTDEEMKRELWIDDLEQWFPEGPDDPNVVLIKVTPSKVAYWSGEGDGELTIE